MSVRRKSVVRWLIGLAALAAGVGVLARLPAAPSAAPVTSRVSTMVTGAAADDGTKYYVSSSGDDEATGHSPARAWRTVARVNRAALRPGDAVAFRGGQSFADRALTPRRSGTSRGRIRFGSFGGGEATLNRGIALQNVAWLTFEGLNLRGSAEGIGTGGGSGALHIDVLGNTITDVQRAINAANPADRAWRIDGNRIARTGDSGVITQGFGFSITRNTIVDTGRDARIPYGKHGIYSKSAHVRIVGNVIRRFKDEGVSTRYRDALIVGNYIEGGASGLGYYRDDSGAGGTTVICGNTIARVPIGLYIGPEGSAGRTTEGFVMKHNVVVTSRGLAVDASADRHRVQTSDNDFRQGALDSPLPAAASADNCAT